jgi:CsoR family transcriptional regulator, copper-sensing transcriptional repressor
VYVPRESTARKPAVCHDGTDRCANGPTRGAVAVDPVIKATSLKRLKRIEGQIRGLYKMVETERYCGDVLTQLGAVQEALRAVGKELMRNHLRHCASASIRIGGSDADAVCDELIELFYKNAR